MTSMTIQCLNINLETAKNPHLPSRYPPPPQLHPIHALPHRKQPLRPAQKTRFQATQNHTVKTLTSKTNNSPLPQNRTSQLPNRRHRSEHQRLYRPPLPIRLRMRTSRTGRPHHPPHKRLPGRHQLHQLHPPTPLVSLSRPTRLRFRTQTTPKQQTQRPHRMGPQTGRRAAVGV